MCESSLVEWSSDGSGEWVGARLELWSSFSRGENEGTADGDTTRDVSSVPLASFSPTLGDGVTADVGRGEGVEVGTRTLDAAPEVSDETRLSAPELTAIAAPALPSTATAVRMMIAGDFMFQH